MSMAFDCNHHIGIIVPASNLTVEREVFGILFSSNAEPDIAARIHFHVARSGFQTRYRESPEAFLQQVADGVLAEARKLAKIPLTSCGFFCTSATPYLWDRPDLMEEIGRTLGFDLATPIESLVVAMLAAGVRSPLMVTPYRAELSETLGAQFAKHGVLVTDVVSLNLSTGSELLEYSSEKLHDLISARYRHDRHDAVCVLCTNFPTFHTIPVLEQELGVPIFSSNMALVSNLLSKIGAFVSRTADHAFGIRTKP